MPVFAYKAVDRESRLAQGRMHAPDADAAVAEITALGHTPIELTEIGDSEADCGRAIPNAGRKKAEAAVAALLAQTHVLLRAGMPLERALLLVARAKDRTGVAMLARALHERVKSGATLAAAIRHELPGIQPFIANTVAAGEASGKLEDVLDRVVVYLTRQEKMRTEINSALVYPAILIVMAGVSISILMLILIPRFKPLFEDAGDRLPPMTLAVLALSDAFLPLVAGLVTTGIIASLCLRHMLSDDERRRQWDRRKLFLPAVGPVLRDTQVAMSARLLALLLNTGVPLHRALMLTRDSVPNGAVAASLADAADVVRQGGQLSTGLTSAGLVPETALDLLRVGEEASDVPGVLNRIADMAESNADTQTKRLMDLLVPLLTIVLGFVIAGVIVSILFALLSINELALQ